MRNKRRKVDEEREIAKDRIDLLFELARTAAIGGDLETANRYVRMLWRIKLKFRISLNKEQRRSLCRKCLTFFIEGKTSMVRVKDKGVRITCLKCGYVKIIPASVKKVKADS